MKASIPEPANTPAATDTASQPGNPQHPSASRKPSKTKATAASRHNKDESPRTRSGTKTAKILRLLARSNDASLVKRMSQCLAAKREQCVSWNGFLRARDLLAAAARSSAARTQVIENFAEK